MTDGMIHHLLAAVAICLCVSVCLGQPSAATTGPTGSLKASSGLTITTSGAVIEGLDISGTVSVKADNVTIRNCRIRTTSSYGINASFGFKGLVVEDTEIRDMQSAGIYGSGFTARRLHVWNSGNDGFKPGTDFIIEDCYIEKLGYIASAHADGIQMVSGGRGVVRRNTFAMTPGKITTEGLGDAGTYKNSHCLIIQTNNGPIDDVLIEGNWIDGGGYSIQVRDKGTGYGAPVNVRIANNTFGRSASIGPWAIDGDAVLCGNRWDDTSALLDKQNSTDCGSTPGPAQPPDPATDLRIR